MKASDLLDMPRLGLASFRRRILLRGVFLLLALTTLAMAVVLLQDEKERSYSNYQLSFKKTQAEILARLRHPAGLLALLNPDASSAQSTPLRPLLLPYGALDFDDQNKVQQAVELAGCSVRYPDGSTLCVGVGNNPYAGGFIYLVGNLAVGDLVARERGVVDLGIVHRARVSLTMRGETLHWIAPLELSTESNTPGVRGRLTGFAGIDELLDAQERPVRDFRGLLWQSAQCVDGTSARPDCAKRTAFSIRLPVEAFREALFAKQRPVWPPADLQEIKVRVEMLAPGAGAPLFDSNAPGAVLPPALSELRGTLLPGEVLRIRRLGATAQEVIALKAPDDSNALSSPWLNQLIRLLPVDLTVAAQSARDTISTPVGSYEIHLSGDVRGVEQTLGVVATRVSWFVGAMLGAIGLAWLLIEVGLIRRIKVLTQRAAAVSYNVQSVGDGTDLGRRAQARMGELDVSDLRGADELGILAGGLADLLKRVQDDVQREHIRAAQERNMWHAVGHEIMSPLQSLMVLHAKPEDASHRYVARMQQAVGVLYGHASPAEALQAAALPVGAVELNTFLHNVAANAHFVGIDDVYYMGAGQASVLVRGDEFSLEDVVTHLLRNAQRHRTPGSPITIGVDTSGAHTVSVTVHNCGAPIEPALLERIFEYGVSGPTGPGSLSDPVTPGQRGQGLFVARTYMSKMGGTITARNVADGVVFELVMQRAG